MVDYFSIFPTSLAHSFLSSCAETNANEKQAKCKQDIFLLISKFKNQLNDNSFLSHWSAPRC